MVVIRNYRNKINQEMQCRLGVHKFCMSPLWGLKHQWFAFFIIMSAFQAFFNPEGMI
jgi:hypothetical protein